MTAKPKSKKQESPVAIEAATPAPNRDAEDAEKTIEQAIRRRFATRQRRNGLQGDEEYGNYHFSL